MNFNIGDKVKFLNSKGGGVISKILDSRMVSVAVEGGFEIPTLNSELIRMETAEPASRFFSEKYDTGLDVKVGQVREVGQVENEPMADNRMSDLPAALARNRKSEDIYLAFYPHEQKWLISGPIDIFLINNSSFDILYNLYLQNPEGDYRAKDYGSCFPDSRLLLDTITREQLPDWISGYLQFLFHNDSYPEVLPPFNSEFRITGQKFYNEASYKVSPYSEGKIILAKIVSISEYLKFFKSKKDKVPGRPGVETDENLIERHMLNQREAEVDLHIHELIEDPGSLDIQEILNFQKNYFERCLESAIAENFLKVTFIHGVGNGVLRENILEILKKYEELEVLDAPMHKYGVGAIEIRIPHNK